MANLNLGARPNIPGWLVLTAVDLKVTDPAAADPNAAVDVINLNTPLRIVLAFRITGNLKGSFNTVLWDAIFFADAIGVDVPFGEVHWQLPPTVPTAIGNDTYEISYTLPAGLHHEAIYEFGVIAKIPVTGINVYAEGLHVEVTT